MEHRTKPNRAFAPCELRIVYMYRYSTKSPQYLLSTDDTNGEKTPITRRNYAPFGGAASSFGYYAKTCVLTRSVKTARLINH